MCDQQEETQTKLSTTRKRETLRYVLHIRQKLKANQIFLTEIYKLQF